MDPYQAPRSEVCHPEATDLGGGKLGSMWLGIPGTGLCLLGGCLGIVSDFKSGSPESWTVYIYVLLATALVGGLGFFLGAILGKRLEPGAWWLSAFWSFATGISWGPLGISIILVARLVVALLRREHLSQISFLPPFTSLEWGYLLLIGLIPTLPGAIGLGIHLRLRRRSLAKRG